MTHDPLKQLAEDAWTQHVGDPGLRNFLAR